jgi:hypothetical protein
MLQQFQASQSKSDEEGKKENSDIGSDVMNEFLENPGTLFWLAESVYNGVSTIATHVGKYSSRPRKN